MSRTAQKQSRLLEAVRGVESSQLSTRRQLDIQTTDSEFGDLSKRYEGVTVSGNDNRVLLGDQITINQVVADPEAEHKIRVELLKWLSKIPYHAHHRAMAVDFLPGSGKWLVKSPEFVKWLSPGQSSVLWLHGTPGSGKSRLCYAVIEYLQRQREMKEPLAPTAYFYCSRQESEPERSVPEEVVQSLLKQLCSFDARLHRSPVTKQYQKLKKDADRLGDEPARLTLEESETLILKLLRKQPAILVIDGLDECDHKRRYLLLRSLEKIVQKSKAAVKIFVASRHEDDIVNHFEEVPNISIKAKDNREDINRYVVASIEEAISCKRLLGGKVSKDLKAKIIEALVEGAHETFQWASLQVDNLCDSMRMIHENDVLAELGMLPQTLKASYSSLYLRMQNTGPTAKELAIRTINWLLSCQRPLNSEEFRAAVSWAPGKTHIHATDSQILASCCNLVTHDQELDRFRFSHLSVREFFEDTDDFKSINSQSLALSRCINVCNTESGGSLINNPPFTNNAVLKDYALQYMDLHCMYIPSAQLWGLFKSFLFDQSGKCSRVFEWWTRSIHSRETNSWLNFVVAEPPNPAFLACQLGKLELLKEIKSYAQINWLQKSVMGMSFLEFAARENLEEIVEWFLQEESFAQLFDAPNLNRAIIRACEAESITLASRLLAERTKRSAKPLDRTPGWKKDCCFLVLDIHAPFRPKLTTALIEAVLAGNLELVNMLLEAGQDAFGQISECSPLQHAITSANIPIIKRFLEIGGKDTSISVNRDRIKDNIAWPAKSTELLDAIVHNWDPNFLEMILDKDARAKSYITLAETLTLTKDQITRRVAIYYPRLLSYAMQNEKFEIASWLISHGWEFGYARSSNSSLEPLHDFQSDRRGGAYNLTPEQTRTLDWP